MIFSMLKYKDNIRETRLRIIKYRRERERERDSVKAMKYMFLSITMYFTSVYA